MPTYDYECSACDYRGEVFQKITDSPLKKCPSCGKPKLIRLFGTGAAIVFKGSGFYQTDYRSDSYRKAAESENKAQSSASESNSKDTTNKPDTNAASNAKSGDNKKDASKTPGKKKSEE